MLEMILPGVENVPTSQETVFKLSRGSQRPYTEKSKKKEIYIYIYILKIIKLTNLASFPHHGTTPLGTTPFYHPVIP